MAEISLFKSFYCSKMIHFTVSNFGRYIEFIKPFLPTLDKMNYRFIDQIDNVHLSTFAGTCQTVGPFLSHSTQWVDYNTVQQKNAV